MVNLIDTHAHLTAEAFRDDLDAVLDRALEKGVNRVVVIGTSTADSRAVVDMAAARENIFAAVGVHPCDAHEAGADWLDEIRELAQRPGVVAIGETGLDFYHDGCPADVQRTFFSAHIELGLEFNKPLIIHSRSATDDTLDTVEQVAAGRPITGIMHCFTGDAAQAERCFKLGLHVSFGGPLTYPRSRPMCALFTDLPLERILLETDSPYLPPQNKRGKRNEPAYVRTIAERAAKLRRIPLEELAAQTTKNAEALFGLA